MSEQTSPEPYSRAFNALEQLEQLDRDDYLAAMWAKVDAAELKLSLEEPTPEQLLKIRLDLDREWRYMAQEVVVSGRAFVECNQTDPREVPTYDTVTFNQDEKMISMGFAILPFEGIYDADETIIQYKIALAFGWDGMLCRMLPEDFIGRFPSDDREAAERRLTYHHNDEVMRIHERLSRAQRPSILDFSDYQLDVYLHARYSESYVRDVETYLFDRLKFDVEVPYLVTGCDDDRNVATIVARPERVELLPLTDNEDESPRRHVPYLHLTRFGETPQDKSRQVRVPFKSLSEVRSLRIAAQLIQTKDTGIDYHI